MEYPLNDVMPSIDHTRDRLLARISEFRRSGEGREVATEQDYELLYAYGRSIRLIFAMPFSRLLTPPVVLVTGQLSEDIRAVSAELQTMFGTLVSIAKSRIIILGFVRNADSFGNRTKRSSSYSKF